MISLELSIFQFCFYSLDRAQPVWLDMAGYNVFQYLAISSSVTRLGDLLDFGQLFKGFGNN